MIYNIRPFHGSFVKRSNVGATGLSRPFVRCLVLRVDLDFFSTNGPVRIDGNAAFLGPPGAKMWVLLLFVPGRRFLLFLLVRGRWFETGPLV